MDIKYLQSHIKLGARVLDLGCGEGSILAELKNSHQVEGLGIEIEPSKIAQCLKKNLCVIQQDLNLGLENFENKSFDVVLMTYALQETKEPGRMLKEMTRIGKQIIVTIPNMGHYSCRLQIALCGRMPISKQLPYNWHDSQNIHVCTLKDFENLCEEYGIEILERVLSSHTILSGLFNRFSLLANLFANLFAPSASYRLRSPSSAKSR